MMRTERFVQTAFIGRAGACGLVLALCAACAPALPASRGRPEDVRRYALNANQAAADARRYADEARVELERSEQLLKEAEEQLRRAEAARAHCAELAAQIKKKPRKVYKSAPAKSPAAEPKPELPKPPAEPTPLPYSPSDAP